MPGVLGAALAGRLRALRAAALPPVRSPGAQALPQVQRMVVSLADTRVELVVRRQMPGGLCHLNLHENEQTSVQAASAALASRPGRLIELRAQGRRLVSFRDGLRPLAFDPNRIFSDTGTERTLRHHGAWTPVAQAAARALRDAVLALVAGDADAPLVALHNNGGGTYSVGSYLAGAVHAADAAAVAVAAAQSPQDFFLVTRRSHFEALRSAGFNAVLQSAQPDDDGSLGVWCARHDRAYINVEARHGHLAEQRRMLEALHNLDTAAP